MYTPNENFILDHRPFLYNVSWGWQFKAIDDMVENLQLSNQINNDERDAINV